MHFRIQFLLCRAASEKILALTKTSPLFQSSVLHDFFLIYFSFIYVFIYF